MHSLVHKFTVQQLRTSSQIEYTLDGNRVGMWSNSVCSLAVLYMNVNDVYLKVILRPFEQHPPNSPQKHTTINLWMTLGGNDFSHYLLAAEHFLQL